jgi:hypothetical protein
MEKKYLSEIIETKNIPELVCVDNIIPIDTFTTKYCYECLVKHVFQTPTAYSTWDKLAIAFDWPKVWGNVFLSDKPTESIELDYKIAHLAIFTKQRLYICNITDNELCPVCKHDIEDISHLFVFCDELERLVKLIKLLLDHVCQRTGYTNMELVSWLLQGYHSDKKEFVNLLLCIYRLAIFKRRNMSSQGVNSINVVKLFYSLFNTHINLLYSNYKNRNAENTFFRKYILVTPFVKFKDNTCALEQLNV